AQVSSNPNGQDNVPEESGSIAYDRLNDTKFANYLSQQARAFASREGSVINVSDSKADSASSSEAKSHQVDPKAISSDYELQRFVMTESGMDQSAAKNFLKDRQDDIAQAAAESQRQWEQA